MAVCKVSATFIITALIVLSGQQNGFVSASTSSAVSSSMQQSTTADLAKVDPTSGFVAASTSSAISSSSSMKQSTTADPVEVDPTSVMPGFVSASISSAVSSLMKQSTTAGPAKVDPTSGEQKSPEKSIAEKFHVTMIVMIVVLGFIIIFSVSCGLCVIYGIDIGCPIPCCGGGGKSKNPAISATGMKLKRSSRPDRISSHRLHDVEEFREVECKGFKGHESAYENIVAEF